MNENTEKEHPVMSKTTTAPAFEVRIRADKSGPTPAPGQPWPLAGVELPADLPKDLTLPTSFIRRHEGAPWLEMVGTTVVERPSQPNPDYADGSAVVKAEHRVAGVGFTPPHVFLHVEKFVFHTLNHGDVTYKVVSQPDKYVGDGSNEAKVTAKIYDSGNTRVDHFYTCTLED